jgi:anti-sigma factor (TIGR02949 family)
MSGHPKEHRGEECREVFARLSDYLDQELPEGDCKRLRQHIEGCAPCVEFIESLKKTIALCHEYQQRAPQAPFPEEVRAKMLACYQKMLAARTGKP